MLSGKQLWRGWSAVGLLLSGLVVMTLVGCGGGNPFDQVKVSGKVTYEDGSPIAAERIRLVFTSLEEPIDRATNPRPGYAEVTVETGEFTCATTLKYGDGLILGKHRVSAVAYEGSSERPLELTPAEIEVTPEQTVFEFKAKKP